MIRKEDAVGRWISLLYRYGHIYIGKRLESYHIGKGQFMFLVELFERDGINQDELAENLNIDKATTARALLKLEQEGYILREKKLNDRRSNKVFLTDKARDIKTVLFSVVDSWTEALTNGFSLEEKKQVLIILEKMSYNASQVTKGRLKPLSKT